MPTPAAPGPPLSGPDTNKQNGRRTCLGPPQTPVDFARRGVSPTGGRARRGPARPLSPPAPRRHGGRRAVIWALTAEATVRALRPLPRAAGMDCVGCTELGCHSLRVPGAMGDECGRIVATNLALGGASVAPYRGKERTPSTTIEEAFVASPTTLGELSRSLQRQDILSMHDSQATHTGKCPQTTTRD